MFLQLFRLYRLHLSSRQLPPDCQLPTYSVPAHEFWLPEANQPYSSLCLLQLLDSDSDEMPHQRALVWASEKMLKVLDGANQ